MNVFLASLGTALWSGLLTTLHPCPMATNIAGIVLLSQWFRQSRKTLFAAICYIVGGITAYLLLGWIITSGLLAVENTAAFFQGFFTLLLGPCLLLSGMILSGLFFNSVHNRFTTWLETGFLKKRYSSAGSFFLGFILSYAFCPATAALFFGVLIPLAVVQKSLFLIPLLYGLGAGLPAVVIVLLVIRGVNLTGRRVQREWLEVFFTRVCGVLLIFLGIYISLDKIFRLF